MILWLLLLSSTLWAKELSLLTLNLHGYHPMNEERRILQYPDGTKSLSWSHLHYFTPQEIERGLNERQQLLAQHITQLVPDIIFLQEVGGGSIQQQKSCRDFYQHNTARDLSQRTSNYRLYPACRGNLGWWTDENTFNNFSISSEKDELIFSSGDNPYPQALIIEGLAILTGPAIKVLDHQKQAITINAEGETFYFQLIKFTYQQESEKYWLALNIHGGHKVQHFEQAVATRKFISQYLSRQEDQKAFAGLIVAGDFNAYESQSEVSTIPWSFFHAWQTRQDLKHKLTTLNFSNHKPFATLSAERAAKRIPAAIESLFAWFSWKRHAFDDSLKEVSLNSACHLLAERMKPFCKFKEKIDHIYLSDNLKIKNYSGVYRQNNWTDLSGTISDHPGLFTIIDLQD